MESHRSPELDWCWQHSCGLRLIVHITPNAKKTEVIGALGDAIKIKLHAQPIEGKANDALIRFLATRLDVPRSAIAIVQGQTSRRKTIEIKSQALSVGDVVDALARDGH